MIYETLGQRLRRLRKSVGLSQDKVAGLLQIRQSVVSRWECDVQCIPNAQVSPLAGVLGVEERILLELNMPIPRGHRCGITLRSRRWKMERIRHPNVVGSFDDVADLGETGAELVACARRRLNRSSLARLEHRFERDSPAELLAALHFVDQDAYLAKLTLAQLRCPALVVRGARSTRNGLWLTREALVLERGEVTIVLFSQVWIVSVVQAEWYRLDYLGALITPGAAHRWFDLEIDGKQHEFTADRDVRRAHGIGLPRLGYTVREVLRHDFGTRALERILSLAGSPEPPEFVPARKAA